MWCLQFSQKANEKNYGRESCVQRRTGKTLLGVVNKVLKIKSLLTMFSNVLPLHQRYTYRVLQIIQMKLILLYVWAERAILGSAKTALKFEYEIKIG